MYLSNLTTYVKLALMSTILLSILSVMYFVNKETSKQTEHIIKSEHNYVIKSLNGYLEHFNEDNKIIINSFFKNFGSLNSLKKGDREAFYKQILPLYKEYKIQDPSLWGLHIILADGMSFTRVHSPQTPNGLISNKKELIKKVLHSKKIEIGFEVGKFGYFYHLIYPLFMDGVFLGVAEFSYKINYMMDDLKKHFDMNIAFVFKEDSKTKKLINYKYKSTNGYIIQYATNVNMYKSIAKLSISNNHFSTLEVDKKIYSTYIYKLTDLQNKSKIISLYDITLTLQERKNTLYHLLGILIIFALIMILLTNVIINIFIKRIKLRKQEAKEKTDELYFRSRHNDITQLENIIVMHEKIKEQDDHTLLLLNIDNVPILHTTYGSDVVDKLLLEFTKHLQNNLLKSDTLYHISAHEFSIVLHEPVENQAIELSAQIKAYFEHTPLVLKKIKIHAKLSVGISLHKQKHSQNTLDTFSQARIALLEAKHKGKNLIEIYRHEMSNFGSYTQLSKNISLLERDLEEEGLIPFYQSIVDTQTKKIFKYEVLARLQDKSGFIQPSKFLQAAKVSGLESSITKQIIQKSFKYFASTQIQFSINITTQDFLENYLTDFLNAKTRLHNINPKNVTLEILEDIVIENDADIVTQINNLASLGYIIAIDDFGVESSNMTKLATLNAKYIKIDGLFIKDINENSTHRHIVEALVFIAKKLDMEIIAEYVHNEEIFEIVKDLGIHYAQGYYLGEPKISI